MPYVDGFLIPVPENRLKDYRAMARKAAKIWMELGALEYRECVLDDGNADFGHPFTKAAKCKPGETVMFSWIVYRNRAHRDRVNKLIMNDPRMAKMMEGTDPPFNYKRMSFGGFKVLVEALAKVG